jgi:cytochrome oxidase assembly protein ShyY1
MTADLNRRGVPSSGGEAGVRGRRILPGRMLRFLWKPRWLALLAITLVVSTTCVRLGIWQLHRLQQRRAYNAAVSVGLSKPPAPLAELIPPGSRVDQKRLGYRRVVVTGTYDVSHEVVLYGRAQQGLPGNHVLTPLVMPDGRAVIVDRGWVPFSTDAPPVEGAGPPQGRISVTGVLEPTDPPGRIGRQANRITTTTTIDVPNIAKDIPRPTLSMFVWLQSQRPGQPAGLPAPAPLPPLSEGPHEGYMLQWFAFALIFFGGYVLLAWKEAHRWEGPPEPGASAPSRTLVA